MAITVAREYDAPLLVAAGIGCFRWAFVLALDRYLVMTISVSDAGRLARGLWIAASIAIALLISAQNGEQVVSWRYADHLAGIREEQKMLALIEATATDRLASGLDEANRENTLLTNEAADLRSRLSQRPPDVSALLEMATALENGYAAQAAQNVGSTRAPR